MCVCTFFFFPQFVCHDSNGGSSLSLTRTVYYWTCVLVYVTSSGKYYAHVKWIRKYVVSNCLHTAELHREETNAKRLLRFRKLEGLFFFVRSPHSTKLIIVVCTRVHRISPARTSPSVRSCFCSTPVYTGSTALPSQQEPQIKCTLSLLFHFYPDSLSPSLSFSLFANTLASRTNRIAFAFCFSIRSKRCWLPYKIEHICFG